MVEGDGSESCSWTWPDKSTWTGNREGTSPVGGGGSAIKQFDKECGFGWILKNRPDEEGVSFLLPWLTQTHPLLKDLAGDPVPSINLVSKPLVPAYDVTQDEEMTAIRNTLSKHLSSLDANLKEMQDVRVWINRAEESMGEILRRMGLCKALDGVNEAELM
jgi:hypothetical protein